MLKPCLKSARLSLAMPLAMSLAMSLVLLLTGCGQQIFKTVIFWPAEKLPAHETPCPYFQGTGRSCTDTRFEEVFFPSLDQETMLQALFFPNPESDKVLVYFHGNSRHVYARIPPAIRLSGMVNVFILSYRGYGKSTGEPSEAGIYEDAEAALGYVREQLKFKTTDTYIYGRSLGAAVAVEVAQQRSYAGLILIAPFLSGEAMARERRLGWVPGLKRPFHSVEKVRNITAPALFVHGTHDRVVPYAQGRALYEAYRSQNKTFRTIEGGGHNDQLSQQSEDAYWEWIREFIEQE